MTQPFETWNEFAKKLQAPLQEMTELNLKTLQGFSVKPDALANLKTPEELLEKQISLAIENGHKALDYLQKSLAIFEKTMFSLVQEVKNNSEAQHE